MYYGFGANAWLTTPGTTLATEQASFTTVCSIWMASDPNKRIRSILARKLTPRCAYSHTLSSGTNVTTTATITGVDGLLPANGTSVTLAGNTPAAYNGTFTVTRSSAGTFDVTLGSDPGGPTTVQGTWTDNGITSSSMAFLNNCWGPEGSAPLGNARFWNDFLDTQIADGKLLSVLNLPTNRAGTDQTQDPFYRWASSNPAISTDGTHLVPVTWQVEKGDIQPALQALV
jgi:hypothetical protein